MHRYGWIIIVEKTKSTCRVTNKWILRIWSDLVLGRAPRWAPKQKGRFIATSLTCVDSKIVCAYMKGGDRSRGSPRRKLRWWMSFSNLCTNIYRSFFGKGKRRHAGCLGRNFRCVQTSGWTVIVPPLSFAVNCPAGLKASAFIVLLIFIGGKLLLLNDTVVI